MAAKVIGGIIFLSVFVLNIVMYVHKDNESGEVLVAALKAYANGESGGGGLEKNLQIVPTGCYVKINGKDVLVGYSNDCDSGADYCTDHECN